MTGNLSSNEIGSEAADRLRVVWSGEQFTSCCEFHRLTEDDEIHNVKDEKVEEVEGKAEVEGKITVIDAEIEELEQLLEKKRTEREQFVLTRQNFEREIDKSRAKYRDQILKLEKELDKVQRDEDKNHKEAEE